MIHFKQTPYACSLSNNPIAFELFADNYTAESDVYPSIVLTFSRSAVIYERYFSWNFINPSTGLADEIKFLAVLNPEENGYHIPGTTSTSNTLPTEQYMADVFKHMQFNEKLMSFYELTRVDNVITATAKQPIAELIPTDFYLSDTQSVNGVKAINETISTVFWKANKRADFRLNTQVFFEREYLSGNFELVFEGTSTVDATGHVDLDVSGIIHAEIKNTFDTPPLLTELPTAQVNKANRANVLRRFYVTISERWTNMKQPVIWDKSAVLFAHFGGVSDEDFSKNHPIHYLQSTNSFLTSWPDKKRLYDNQSDWLSWMNVAGQKREISIDVKIYYTDGTNASEEIGTIALNKWETVTVPVGYMQLMIEDIDATKIAHAWEIIIKESNDPIATRRYIRTMMTNVFNQTLAYLNNYGVQETFYTTGFWKNTYTSKKDVATKTLRHDYLSINGQDFVFQQISRNTFTARTGSLRNSEAKALQDLLNTAPTFLYKDFRFVPIIIEQGSFDIEDENEILQTIEMKVTKSMALRNYSNQEDIPTLTIIQHCGITQVQVNYHKIINNYGNLIIRDSSYNEVEVVEVQTNGLYTLSEPIATTGQYIIEVGLSLENEFLIVSKVVQYNEEVFSFDTPFYTSGSINDNFQIKTNDDITLRVDWDKNEDILSYAIDSDTVTLISEDSFARRGKRNIKCSAPCLGKITQFTIQSKAYRNFKLNKLTGLERLEIVNCNLPGHFSVAAFPKLVYCYLNGNQLTSFEIGINLDLYIVDLQNNLLDNAAVLDLCRSLYNYRNVLDFLVFFLQGNPDEGNYSQEVLDIVNGTGAYSGDGLIQNNIQIIL